MSFNECVENIKSDLRRLTNTPDAITALKLLITNHSFKITFWFRLGNYLLGKKNLFFKLIYYIVFLIHKRNQRKFGIQISFNTKVGKGLTFPHFSCIVINSKAQIGDDCTIFQGTTIGSVRGENSGAPILGNKIVMCPGCKIIGNITIDDNVFIGPNSVVVKNVERNSTIAGIPAKLINEDGLKNVSFYL